MAIRGEAIAKSADEDKEEEEEERKERKEKTMMMMMMKTVVVVMMVMVMMKTVVMVVVAKKKMKKARLCRFHGAERLNLRELGYRYRILEAVDLGPHACRGGEGWGRRTPHHRYP